MTKCNCGAVPGQLHKDWCASFISPKLKPVSKMKTFASGATRHVDDRKVDYEGHLSPWALRRYGEYMNSHRVDADGNQRDSDNWQKGIPLDAYMKSLLRHTFDAWWIRRGLPVFDTKDDHQVDIEEALCGIIFNAMGYLHEHLRKNALGKPSTMEEITKGANEGVWESEDKTNEDSE